MPFNSYSGKRYKFFILEILGLRGMHEGDKYHEVIHKSVYTFLQKDPEFLLGLKGVSNVLK